MTAPTSDHPAIRDVPIGLHAGGRRREFDSMGDVDVPATSWLTSDIRSSKSKVVV